MNSYLTYKVLHLVGIFLILTSMGGLLLIGSLGNAVAPDWRKRLSITNGVGLLLTFFAGLALLTQIGLGNAGPGWIFLKMLIWVILAILVVAARKKPAMAYPIWWLTISLAGVAAYLAFFKPF